MLKRELKTNIKSLIIFTGILVFMLMVVALIYPSFSGNLKDIDKLMEMFPKDVLKAFNMDIVSISTLFGWISSEGYMFIQLLGACFFAILGGTIVLKESSEHTIDFLYSKPVSKQSIIVEKMKCGAIYIIIFNVLIAITTFIGLKYNNDFMMKDWLLISFAPIITNLFFFTLSMYISLYLKKTSQSIGVCIGSVFVFYMINMIANLSDKVEWLKYTSIFYYTDSKDIITDSMLDPNKIFPILVIILVIRALAIKKYNKKELGI